jgi:hypothetical protein
MLLSTMASSVGSLVSAAWPIVDHSHLAEDAVGAHALEHIAECDDVDAAGVHDVEAVAGIVLEEDALAGVAAAELDAPADQRSEIERGLCHALALW